MYSIVLYNVHLGGLITYSKYKMISKFSPIPNFQLLDHEKYCPLKI